MNNKIIMIGKGVLLLLLIAFLIANSNTNSNIDNKTTINTNSFLKAKQVAEKKLYTGDLKVDFYCGCKYRTTRKIDTTSCKYRPRKNVNRGKRIEYEHIVPASWFGQKLYCWNNGGRKNCSTNNEQFKIFESDLHNLRPVIGEINGDRSNMPYGISSSKKKQYGDCPFFIDFKNDRAEPPDNIKGDIARVVFYIHSKYNMTLSKDDTLMFNEWIKLDPPDSYEREVNRKIYELQGDSNPWITGE